MQALLERIKQEGPHEIIQNSDSLYKKDIKWIDTIPYEEPNQYEKDMIKDTLKPEALLEKEK